MSHFGVSVHIVEPGTYFTSINDAATMKRNTEAAIADMTDELKKQYGRKYCEQCKYMKIKQQICQIKTKKQGLN